MIAKRVALFCLYLLGFSQDVFAIIAKATPFRAPHMGIQLLNALLTLRTDLVYLLRHLRGMAENGLCFAGLPFSPFIQISGQHLPSTHSQVLYGAVATYLESAPAWYQTGLFHFVTAAAIIFVCLFIYLFHVRRVATRIELRLNARMAERMRLSRELHDTLLQSLQGMVLRFSSFTECAPPDVKKEMERVLEDAEWLLVSGRDRIKEMRAHYSYDENVTVEIRRIIDGLFNDDGCKVNLTVQGDPVPLNSLVCDETVWIAREALTNACRHSKAEHVDIEISYAPKEFRITIEDDGIGVDASAFLAHYSGHVGLVGMRERAEAIGARFNVRSIEGKGTSILFSLPTQSAFAPRANRWTNFFKLY
jgi:signal transduction histidine kinase